MSEKTNSIQRICAGLGGGSIVLFFISILNSSAGGLKIPFIDIDWLDMFTIRVWERNAILEPNWLALISIFNIVATFFVYQFFADKK